MSQGSSTITLCLSLFPWTEYKRAKGGVKAHIMLDHDDTTLRQPAQALGLVPSPVLQSHGALPCPRLFGQEKGQVQIHAQFCSAHRGQGGRCHCGPGAGPKPWLHPDFEPGLPGLCSVWQVDRPRRLFRHLPQI
ncbi:hypothetical protein DFAR_3560003 [Desulfarculales bacterium]